VIGKTDEFTHKLTHCRDPKLKTAPDARAILLAVEPILQRARQLQVMAIVLIAIAVAWMWSWPARLTADEEQTISLGLKNITTSMQKRSCIFRGEMDGLNQINSVLEKHGSGHRVVAWYLPRFCDERQ
jgi:hypothetical protein